MSFRFPDLSTDFNSLAAAAFPHAMRDLRNHLSHPHGEHAIDAYELEMDAIDECGDEP